ncbi:copper amine oxidase N-terminal domain-containing protein [Paenibacillus sp. MWE-103]|uniref:Copper amine oxidase N-terminal domain-containing protein n=1 Tax=Paenibacillus artemisiicola TaxID=1172618 RepID=A0ABS3WBY9_9BACL|nr:copper amine oxidase N-terminal domain-containing protein [Paenibacillus artemisiicola]MBO7745821.1 copper amine oxidase N-terminal domain-containing protein [Paenibacillus artemisiicola]
MMNKKSLTGAIIATVMASSIFNVGFAAAAGTPVMRPTNMPIKVLYNARQIATDVQPVNVNGTVLVPIRFVSDKLGGKLTLTGKKISIVKGSSKLELTIGSSSATINGKANSLPVSVRVSSGRTLVPLRVVSEGLNVSVQWDSVLHFVWIGNKSVPKIEDIANPVNIKPYLPLYKGKEYLAAYIEEMPYSKVAVLTEASFPFILGARTFYRLDMAFDTNNNAYLQTSIVDNTSIGFKYFFLLNNSIARLRSEARYLRTSPLSGIRMKYHPIVSLTDKVNDNISNYESLSIRNISYIGIREDFTKNNELTAILIKNPWR